LEKLGVPEGLDALDELLVEDAGRLEEPPVELLPPVAVLPVFPGVVEDVVLLSADLPDAADDVVEEPEDVPEPVVLPDDPPDRVWPVETEPELPPRVVPELADEAPPELLPALLPVAELPCPPEEEPGLEVPDDVLPGVDDEPTFSAVRSMVTGRLPDPAEDALLPGLSPAPEPLPPDEDVPPEDFLSVAISSPPEPDRSQDIHYTHLFAKRYRRGKEFCALQKNDSPGSG